MNCQKNSQNNGFLSVGQAHCLKTGKLTFSLAVILLFFQSQYTPSALAAGAADPQTPQFQVYSQVTLLGAPGVTATVFPGAIPQSAATDEGLITGLKPGDGGLIDSVIFTSVGYEPGVWINEHKDLSAPVIIYLKPTSTTMEKIVVTGARAPRLLEETPVSTEVITSKEIEESGALNLAEAIRFSSGVRINSDFSGDGISIRGVDPSRVLVLIDGERAIGRVGGSIDLSQYSVQNIDHIEIVKGVGSTLYGSDALGGVVNIISKEGGENKELQGALSLGNHSSADPYLKFSKRLENARWNLAGSFHSNAPIDLNPNTLHTNGRDGADRYNFDGVYLRKMGALNLTTRAGVMVENKNWVESKSIGSLGEIPFDDFEDNLRLSLAFRGKYFTSPKFQAEASLSGSYYDHAWEKYTSGGLREDSSISNEYSLEVETLFRRLFSNRSTLTAGAEFRREALESASLSSTTVLFDTAGSVAQVNPGFERIDQLGIFAQFETTLPGGIVALPGVRLESHSNFGEFLSPSLNLMRDLSERYRLRAFIGRGFRAPSIKEQYFEFNHSSEGYLVIGNSDLKPETSINTSLSLEISQGSVAEYRITAYYNHLNNLIDFDSIGNSFSFPVGIYEYRNFISARTRGFEFQSRWNLSGDITLDLSYDYLDADDLETGERLLNKATHTGAALLKLQNTPLYGISFSFWTQFEADKLVLTRAETTLDRTDTGKPKSAPTHAPVGFSLSRELIDELTLSAKVENVFDKTNYLLGQTEPRSVSVRLSYNTL